MEGVGGWSSLKMQMKWAEVPTSSRVEVNKHCLTVPRKLGLIGSPNCGLISTVLLVVSREASSTPAVAAVKAGAHVHSWHSVMHIMVWHSFILGFSIRGGVALQLVLVKQEQRFLLILITSHVRGAAGVMVHYIGHLATSGFSMVWTMPPKQFTPCMVICADNDQFGSFQGGIRAPDLLPQVFPQCMYLPVAILILQLGHGGRKYFKWGCEVCDNILEDVEAELAVFKAHWSG
ncbi:hypothetical protein BS47DRAFT_1365645 [Hydnum rufescens UP504]|uniref:Uncharacterized protein n=1 Tax=Hydnum rufescens UP504 TaxID=1448309 RepID=A0A9P6DPE0_9AGAM|nr:hypothetical protein BS47DRAFT_1365645 [Hydnum rufescens UP504]